MPKSDGMGPPQGGGQGGGMGQGRGMGQGGGRGMGGGMGCGGGRGMGMGFDSSQGFPPTPQSQVQPAGQEGELAMLQQQADAMNQQMQQIQDKIRALSGKSKQGNGDPVAKVDGEGCAGCGICIQACPEGAIELKNNIAVVDEETCTGCGTCVAECPTEAIKFG